MTAGEELNDCIIQLGSEGKITLMQREEFLGGMDEAYTLMIRDYAADSSEENALAIRRRLHETDNTKIRSAKSVAKILGFTDERGEDSVMSLQEILEAVDDDPSRLGEIGVKNPGVLANSLHRMWGKGE